MNRWLIISGGAPSPIPAGDFAGVIACDKGWDYALQAGVRVDCVIGDLDSAQSPVPQGIPLLRLPCEKDDTDTLSAVKWAIAQGAKELVLTCALGGRLDHLLGNLQCMHYATLQGIPCRIQEEHLTIDFLSHGEIRLPREENTALSILSLTDVTHQVTLRGTQYTLTNADVPNAFPIGISNEWAADEAVVTAGEGVLMVLREKMK